ncbi:MAG TPA: P-loop NTPase [Acetobacteraceae bacterium]|nr:P-loop NTPase [Acetobacteraceae bacterium]
MADYGSRSLSQASAALPKARPDRLSVVAFVVDATTEAVLRNGLNDLVSEGLDIRRGSVRSVIAAMMRMPTPEVLIVDISGQENPVQVLGELCDVIEPVTRLLVIGDVDNFDLYKQIIKNIGAVDYVFKPITLEMIGRQLAPLVTRQSVAGDSSRGGRVIAVTGARGGVGASLVAANLAWHLGVDFNRHTILIDADMHAGIMPALLGVPETANLNNILNGSAGVGGGESNDGIVQQIDGRLHLLSGSRSSDFHASYVMGSSKTMIEALRLRYNFIVMDIPFLPLPSHRELLELAHHRIIVLDASIASLRDSLRLLNLLNGPRRLQRPTLVLNRGQRPGSLARKHLEEGLKRKVDIMIPDVSRSVADIKDPESFSKLRKSPFGKAINELSRELGFETGRSASPEPGGKKMTLGSFFGLKLRG